MIRHFLISILVTIIGCLLVWGGCSQTVSVARQKSWPQTEATILKSGLTVHADPVIELQVRYLVDGNETQSAVYTSDFDTEGEGFVRLVITDRIPERYTVGQTVTVFYNPSNRNDARMQFDDSYFAYGFRILIIVLGFVLIFAACALEVVFLYVKFQQWKMHNHLRQARRLIAEGDCILAASDRGLSDRYMQEKRSATKAQLDEMEALSGKIDEEVDIFRSVFVGESKEEHAAESTPHQPVRDETIRISYPSPFSSPQNIKTNRLRETIICILFAAFLGALSSWFAPYSVINLRCWDEQRVDCHIQRVLFGILPIGEPQLVNDLRAVGTEFRGRTRTKSGFLVFTGTEKITIPAGHAILSERRISEYLSAPSDRLLLSDGRIIFGLYLPWIIMLLGVFVCVPLWADWNILTVLFKVQATVQQEYKPRFSAVTRFGLGAVITWCVIWGMALVVQDIYRTNVIQWLLLFALSMAGGMVNVWWTRRK